jgi:hypothetical protein
MESKKKYRDSYTDWMKDVYILNDLYREKKEILSGATVDFITSK